MMTRNRNSTPRETILTFEKAINENDINGMIRCLTPELQEKAEDIIDKADEYVDKPLGLIIETMPFLSSILDKDIFPDFEIEILEEDISDKQADISVKMKISKLKIPVKAEFNLHKVKGCWYIKTIKPNIF